MELFRVLSSVENSIVVMGGYRSSLWFAATFLLPETFSIKDDIQNTFSRQHPVLI